MRTQVRLLVLLLLAVPLGAWLPAAGASETWTMTFSSSLNGVMNGNQIRIVSNGSADLVADQAGNFTGSGRASATIIYPPAPPVTYTPLTGEGTFSVTGKRRGDDLGFTFHSSEILCKGTMTVTTPIETITTEVEAPFDPGTLTAADNRTLIERKPGATTTHQKNPAAGLTETVSFIMGAGSDVVMQPPVDPSLFPDEPNIWTLEMELVRNWNVNRPNLQASGSSTLTGSVEFPAPLDEGPARGEGPTMESGTSRTTAPIAVSSSSSETGRLILNGQIKDNVLTFTPRLDTLSARQQGTSGTSSADFGRGLSCTDLGEAEPVSIPMQNGAEVSATYQYPAEGATATVVWRLKGTRIEVWQVRIENSHRHTTGVQPKVGAGVSVQWRVDTRIEIENGNWKSGVTTVSIVQVDSISDPAGVFTISHKTSVSPPYQVNGEKHGNEVHLRFPRSNTSSYRIDYDYKLTGGDLVPVLTAAGVANAASVLATLQKAGTMTDGTTELVPDKNTVYMLPLTDGAVLTSEYGETIAVTRLQ